MEKQIAFVGNPNVGKSAWINALSNANFKVGNWPGVTIEKKEAVVTWGGNTYHLIDLPGTYALDEENNEEGITARYLHQEHVDVIVNIVDATNVSRNLYLTALLRKLNIPMIVVFNFMDEVKKYKMDISIDALQEQMQLPIFPYSAFDKQGYEIIQQAIIQHTQIQVRYAPLLTNELIYPYRKLYDFLQSHHPYYVMLDSHDLQAFAYAMLFQKPKEMRQIRAWDIDVPSDLLVDGLDEDIMLFQYIQEICQGEGMETIRMKQTRHLDRYLLHPHLGIFFLILIFIVLFTFVFQGSAPLNDFIDFFMNEMVIKYANTIFSFLPESAKQLLLQGILAGVGGVLVFVPLMAFLYAVLSFLEESGYMSRIAFLLDTTMQNFNLNGKSFVSLLLGFGCNVPAIYATRTLDNETQKRLTALLVPFMSCGARLPVYMLFAAAFFKEKAALMIISLYGIGIVIALLCALLLSRFQDFHDTSTLILELPPYRWPSYRVIWKKVILEVKGYVRKATGIVMWAMIILWGLSYFPNGKLETSYIAQASKAVSFLYEPLGFGTRWESVAALPGSIVAKETVVGFMDQVLLHDREETYDDIDIKEDVKTIAYEFGASIKGCIMAFIPHYEESEQKDSLVQAIANLWQDKYANLRAYCYMVYILLSIPCIMTLQALGKEYGLKFMFLSILLMLIIPYMLSLSIFQIFSLLI